MNFLAHFYFDGRRDSPYYNLGLVLPDLMGMVQRGWKIGKHQLADSDNPQHQQLVEGVSRHLAMDDWFHDTNFFQEGHSVAKTVMKKAAIQYPPYRVSFLSHIILELMLDRILVKHEPGMVSRFYSELAIVKIDELRRFFYELGVPFNENFQAFYRKFIGKRYALNYANNEAFVEALNNISNRVGQPRITPHLSQNLYQFLPDLELTIFHSFEELKINFRKD